MRAESVFWQGASQPGRWPGDRKKETRNPAMAAQSSSETRSGYTVYNKALLSIYDLFVLGFLCRFMWKCRSLYLLELYNRRVTSNHLDMGVGTGYFLDHCRFPSDKPRIVFG